MIKKIVKGSQTMDGAGVKLTRVLSNKTIYDFDPFLMLDVFDSKNMEDYINGFPMHPHRGIETVTYVIHGEIDHQDSLGNKGTIKDGQSQWMTAGSGILHQEMPQPAAYFKGMQLWVNLPKKDKMTEPVYRDITDKDIITLQENNATIKIISGTYKNKSAKNQGDYVRVQFYDIGLQPNIDFELSMKKDDNAFIYIIDGSLEFEDVKVDEKSAVLLENTGILKVKSGPKGARFAYLSGKPLKESIEWGGPIVMNTQEELHRAFDELNEETFIKHKKPVKK